MKPYCYKYPRPAVTADLVILAGSRENREILLIQRDHDPFAGTWALPGGFVDENEDLPDAARRELKEETGVDVDELRQVGAFGKPGRDPRGHVITVAYVVELPDKPGALPGDDAREVAWYPLEDLPEMAFDHADILRAALEKIDD